jgi:SnoaL-like domain
MSDRTAMERTIGLYFKAINGDDASIVPLADDVVLCGPMLPEPITGEAAVRQHIVDIAPFVARWVEKFSVIEGDSAAVILEFEGLNGLIMEGAEFFRIRDGKICDMQNFFDTRPLIKGAN